MGERVRYARSGDVSIAYVDFAGGPADVVFVTGFASNVGSAESIPAGCRTSPGSLGW